MVWLFLPDELGLSWCYCGRGHGKVVAVAVDLSGLALYQDISNHDVEEDEVGGVNNESSN
jgi:hypothetical protein